MISFDEFLLPKARIATRPIEQREQANLLSCIDPSCFDPSCFDSSCLQGAPQGAPQGGPQGAPQDLRVKDLPSLLKRGDVVVLNDTKVLPARLCAKPVDEKETAEIEHTLETTSEDISKVTSEVTFEITFAEKIEPGLFRAFVKGKVKGKGKEQTRLQFGRHGQPFFAHVDGRDADGLLRLRFEGLSDEELYDRLEAEGAMPLPPYMKRNSDAKDRHDYQTLFARHRGAFAAPTAGRHLTPRLIEAMQHKGIETLFVTLHVSFGSFRPVRSVLSETPRMAREAVVVSPEVFARIQACKQRGGRVLAVGTTVVRALEAAAMNGGAFCGETDLFIGEGFNFRCCDLLLTNFHQAHATPLLLTCAFAGEESVQRAYAHARAHTQYRFFSYGDACLFARRK